MWPVTIFRLVSERTEPGLFCGADDLLLAGVRLLTSTRSGLAPRPADELQQIFYAAYGVASGITAESRLSGLRSIARALDDGDLCRATILSLQLALPDVYPSGVARLTEAGILLKLKYDGTEPRDSRGRWTTGGGQTGSVTPESTGTRTSSSPWRGRWPDVHRENPNITPVQAGALPFPVPMPLGGFAVPRPKKDDDDDYVYPPVVPQPGTGNPANDNSDANTDARAAANDNAPKACPNPSYELDSVGRTLEELRYQAQINKLPQGWHVVLNGVGYDGCRNSDEHMLEAKFGRTFLLDKPPELWRVFKAYNGTMRQAGVQNANSGGRRVEWHFSDLDTANFWEARFFEAGYKNIDVEYTSYDETYNYNLDRDSANENYRQKLMVVYW